MNQAVAYHPVSLNDVEDGKMKQKSSFQIGIFVWITLYIVSGITQPLIMDVLKDTGFAKEPSTFIYNLPLYVGMAFAYPFSPKKSTGVIRWSILTQIILLDVVAIALCYAGNLMAGSIIYTIIYSSVTLWTAIFSILFLKRSLSTGQWIGCILVTSGISFTAIGSTNEGRNIFLGTLMVLFGTCLHSSTYILTDYVFRQPQPITEDLLCSLMGCGGMVLLGIYQISYTLPHFDDYVAKHVREAEGSIPVIMFTLFMIALMALLHSIAFFRVVNKLGCVTAGICKGLQAVGTMCASHFFFCSETESMCFTWNKALAGAIVVCGVFIYSFSKRSHDG